MRDLSVPLSTNCTLEHGGQSRFNEHILRPASFQALAWNTLILPPLGKRIG